MPRTRVFLIDEHGPSREMLARRLASFPGFDVVGTAADGGEGLRQIKALAPDLVLLDIKMKRADGLEVCRQVCSGSGTTRVAVLTSYIDPEERKKAREAGASGYLLKEVDTARLAQRIRLLAVEGQATRHHRSA